MLSPTTRITIKQTTVPPSAFQGLSAIALALLLFRLPLPPCERPSGVDRTARDGPTRGLRASSSGKLRFLGGGVVPTPAVAAAVVPVLVAAAFLLAWAAPSVRGPNC